MTKRGDELYKISLELQRFFYEHKVTDAETLWLLFWIENTLRTGSLLRNSDIVTRRPGIFTESIKRLVKKKKE